MCALASEVDVSRDPYWGPYTRQARQRLDKLYRDLRRPLPKKETHAPRDLSYAMTPALALMAALAKYAQVEIILFSFSLCIYTCETSYICMHACMIHTRVRGFIVYSVYVYCCYFLIIRDFSLEHFIPRNFKFVTTELQQIPSTEGTLQSLTEVLKESESIAGLFATASQPPAECKLELGMEF